MSLTLADQIKFVFTLIDPANHDCEFSFILDISENKVYKGKFNLLKFSKGMYPFSKRSGGISSMAKYFT
jgi:hypothetical protein